MSLAGVCLRHLLVALLDELHEIVVRLTIHTEDIPLLISCVWIDRLVALGVDLSRVYVHRLPGVRRLKLVILLGKLDHLVELCHRACTLAELLHSQTKDAGLLLVFGIDSVGGLLHLVLDEGGDILDTVLQVGFYLLDLLIAE